MSPIFLELIVLGLGLGMLLIESFAERLNRNTIAIIGIIGLACVFLLLQFGSFSSTAVTGYTQDKAALFFKKFALVTTIIVLIMSIDYSDTIRKFVRGISPQAGIGEFYSLPILTCAGMMWMASATDFVLIFISLEIVTVSFYALVAFTRRNPLSLEAGAKYLILGALSTGFFVYGITWIYGVTQHTNLPSIGLTGSLLMAVACFGALAAGLAVVVYLAAYLLMTLLSFLILIIVAKNSEGDDITHFNGLSKRSPFLAFSLLVALMSLAVVQLTAGFLGKFLVFKVAFESQQFLLIFLAVITVGCGFYYYLKVVRAMYWQTTTGTPTAIPVSLLSTITIGALVVLIFLFGIFPQFGAGLLS